MSRYLFLRIQFVVETHDPHFVQKRDVVGFLSLSYVQKITDALRMLSYGVAANYVDEYVRIGKSTAVESLKKFVKAIVSIFSKKYMRSPNQSDIRRLLTEGESRGFLGMLGSIDYMHWKLKNCPITWKGMYVYDAPNLANDVKRRCHFFSVYYKLINFKLIHSYNVKHLTCKTRENYNFLKKGKIVISIKIQKFYRSWMMNRISPLKSSREI